MVLFVCSFVFKALRPGQQCLGHFGTPGFLGLTSTKQGGEVSCSRTQHRAPGEVRTRDLTMKSPTLSRLSYRCSRSLVLDVTVPFTLR